MVYDRQNRARLFTNNQRISEKPRLEDMKIILTNRKTTIAPFLTDKQVEVISSINETGAVKRHFKGIHRGLRRCTLSSDGTVTNSTQ